MTAEDIERLESALGITLARAYTKVMTVFAIPAYVGNSAIMFWMMRTL